MKASQLISVLKTAIARQWAILIEGSPGIGKSDIVAQVAKETGVDLVISHPVTADPTDYKGLPGIVNGAAEFLPYGDLRRLLTAGRPLVCFIDDLGQGSQATQAAQMQLVLAREINGQKISPHVVFIGATNRRADNAGVSGILSPLRSRFRSSVELTVDAADWCKWALAAGLPVELAAFVNLRPAMLNTFDPKSAKEGKPFACPRTLAFLGEWIAAGVTDAETLCGCVGEAVATEFLGFLAIYRAVAGLPAQICANPQSAAIPQEIDRAFAVSAAMSYHASAKNIDAIGQYFSRPEMPAEFRTFFWKAATARKPELIETRAHQSWAINHADDIQ